MLLKRAASKALSFLYSHLLELIGQTDDWCQLALSSVSASRRLPNQLSASLFTGATWRLIKSLLTWFPSRKDLWFLSGEIVPLFFHSSASVPFCVPSWIGKTIPSAFSALFDLFSLDWYLWQELFAWKWIIYTRWAQKVTLLSVGCCYDWRTRSRSILFLWISVLNFVSC